MKHFYLLLFISLTFYVAGAQTYKIDSLFGNNNNGFMTLKSADSSNILFKNYIFSKSGKIMALYAPTLNNLTTSHGLIQFNENGKSKDSTFGLYGACNRLFDSLNPISPNFNIGYCNAVFGDEKILVGGNRKSFSQPNYYFSSLVCFTKEGKVDSSFGYNGVSYFGFLNHVNDYSRIEKIIAQSGSRAILAINQNAWENNVLCAIKPNGSIDSTYGVNGVQKYNEFEIPNMRQLYSLPALCPDGKLMVYCTQIDTATWVFKQSYFVKLKYDGRPDSSFGVNGKLILDTNVIFKTTYNTSTEYNLMSVLSNHKILQLCLHKNDSANVLVQFLPNGTIDSSFGTNGTIVFPFQYVNANISVTGANSMLPLQNGKIVLCGNYYDVSFPANYDMKITLLNSNGTFDAAFANTGVDIIDMGSEIDDYANVILSSDSSSFYVCGAIASKNYLAVKYISNIYPVNASKYSISKNTVIVSPNPLQNVVHLKFSNALQKANLKLYAGDGKLLFEKRSVSGTDVEFDLGIYADGVYYVEVISGMQKSTMKLVKQ